MSDTSERMHILEMIENGKLSVEQGLQMLKSLVDEEQLTEVEGVTSLNESSLQSIEVVAPLAVQADQLEEQSTRPTSEADILDSQGHRISPPSAEKWRRFWVIPFWVGVAATVLGGWLMYRAMEVSGLGVWFICAAVPFALGLALLVLAWGTRNAPWMHLRAKQKTGEWPSRIAISFPIPVQTTMWFLRTFGRRIPNLGDTALDKLILALGESTSPEYPIFIEVDEGDEGEKVEIYIG